MTHRPDQRPSRRELLRTLGAAPLAISALQAAPAVQAQTSARDITGRPGHGRRIKKPFPGGRPCE